MGKYVALHSALASATITWICKRQCVHVSQKEVGRSSVAKTSDVRKQNDDKRYEDAVPKYQRRPPEMMIWCTNHQPCEYRYSPVCYVSSKQNISHCTPLDEESRGMLSTVDNLRNLFWLQRQSFL